MKPQTLSLDAGLAYQAKHLAQWKPKLSPECFAALSAWVDVKNNSLPADADGYDVTRGSSLDAFILNWKP